MSIHLNLFWIIFLKGNCIQIHANTIWESSQNFLRRKILRLIFTVTKTSILDTNSELIKNWVNVDFFAIQYIFQISTLFKYYSLHETLLLTFLSTHLESYIKNLAKLDTSQATCLQHSYKNCFEKFSNSFSAMHVIIISSSHIQCSVLSL